MEASDILSVPVIMQTVNFVLFWTQCNPVSGSAVPLCFRFCLFVYKVTVMYAATYDELNWCSELKDLASVHCVSQLMWMSDATCDRASSRIATNQTPTTAAEAGGHRRAMTPWGRTRRSCLRCCQTSRKAINVPPAATSGSGGFDHRRADSRPTSILYATGMWYAVILLRAKPRVLTTL